MPVTAARAQADGSWCVETPLGKVHTQWVVNAAGLWARDVAALAGITLPLMPTEHQDFVTETIPEIAAMDRRLPSVADRDGEYYLRQEGKGLLVDALEKDMKFWADDGTPRGIRREVFADDLERDYSPEYWPQETGLAGLIKLEKEFLNKGAYVAIADLPPRRSCGR